MLEFTIAADDAVELARALAAGRGSDVRGRVYFWLVGLLATVLLGALAGWGVGTLLAATSRMPALVGMLVGATSWLVLMALRPNLRRAWSDARIGRHAREDFRPPGVTRVWLDGAGINGATGAVHKHLAWPGIENAAEVGGHVVVTPRHFGPALAVPRRVGASEVDGFAAAVRSRLARPAPDPGHAWPGGAATSGWQYPERGTETHFPVTVHDLQELAARAQARERLPRELRDARRVWTGRTVLASLVVLPLLNRATWGLTGLPGFGVLLALSACAGLVVWLRAPWSFARDAAARAEAEGRHRLAAGGDRRRVWLDDAGVGQEDAVTVEHAAWPAIDLAEGPEHYFLHAPGHFDVVLPRRVPGVEDFVGAVRSRLAVGPT
ncbi:MAG: hypothetical protein KDB60_03060 [Propionibacteriaceae bacterium]|nr:hypothetical protein [Propionibacteriaceae bacterium]